MARKSSKSARKTAPGTSVVAPPPGGARKKPASADVAPAVPPPPQPPGPMEKTLGWAKSIAIALVIWIFLRSLLVEAFHITSGSMENTLLVGDVLFVNKSLYGAQLPFVGTRLPALREPRRNEIVIFDSVEEPGLTVVKRIVGMPGDTVSMRDNVLFIDGHPQTEPFVIRSPDTTDYADPRMRLWQARRVVGAPAGEYRPTLKNWGPVVVAPDSFLMLGDNRDDSYDSRYWGFLGRDRIRGRASIIYYSYDRQGILPLPIVTAVRWGRLFTRIR